MFIMDGMKNVKISKLQQRNGYVYVKVDFICIG